MLILEDSIVALVTPFNEDLSVDYASFANLIDFHLQNGTNGLVISGTTGEAATLTQEEKLKLLQIAVEKAHNKIPIIFNSGTNNTMESINLSKKAQNMGADCLLIVSPYYNRPSNNGLYEHFKTIANSVNIPICLYNVPSRTASNIDVDLVARLSDISNIIAIKDATPCLVRPLEINLKVHEKFTQLSGEDSTILSYLANGGKGCISVSANVIPKECQNIYNLWKKNCIQEALQEHLKIFPLHKILFIESNPVPAKFALSLMGKCNDFVRLPLTKLTENSKQLITEVLKKLQII